MSFPSKLVQIGAALVGAASFFALSDATAESLTIRAIFLPATWGTVVKETLAPQYEKETGVKVEVQLIARDAIHDKMATLFAAKDSSFDVFNMDYSWIPDFGRAGALVALDDKLTAEDKADFFPLALKVASWNGKLYGVPQTIHPHLLWYRKDLYGDPEIQKQYHEQTGQELSPPKTMDEWLQQAKFFNGKTFGGKKIYGWAAQAAKGYGNVHTWLSFLYTYGGQAFNSNFTKPTLNTAEGVAATKQWAEMMKYMPPGSTGFTYDDVTTAAQQGLVATVLQWSWGAFAVDDKTKSQTVGLWEFTQVPAAKLGQPSHPHLAGWVIAVSNYSKHPTEAAKFVTWLETKENDVVQASLGGGDPVRISSYSNPKLTEETLPGTDIKRFRRYPQVLVAMQNAMPRPFFPGEERWETIVTTPLQAIQLGQLPVEQGLKEADDGVRKSLLR
jgi:multiple sugar transport system substrate-binding protein